MADNTFFGKSNEVCSARVVGSRDIAPSGMATLEQFKEHTGFVVSGSLTLTAVPPKGRQAFFDDYHYKKKTKFVEIGLNKQKEMGCQN